MKNRLKAAWLAFWHPEMFSNIDSLTGVSNRRHFLYLAKREMSRAMRGNHFSLAFLDLDGLKTINDLHGHTKGDIFLKELVKNATSHLRPYDLFARWGGDEFVLLLPGVDPEEAETILCRIHALFPCFSWGISCWRQGADLETLLDEADKDMYLQKQK
jgi:diguanylate cyclase (GGDEF)-like protein